MAVPLPATTDVIIKDSVGNTLFTVRCSENVEISWTKEIEEVEEIGDVEPSFDDFRFTRQAFKVTGNLVSTAGANPEQGDDDLKAQYTQFITALDKDDLLNINVTDGDGNVITENGHFLSASMTLEQGIIQKWSITFDFGVGQIYNRL